MKIVRPDINPTFFYGPVISYHFNGGISKDKGKYRIRFTLTFKSGNIYQTQKSGFRLESEARRAREVLISQLEKHEYIPFDYTVQEFFDYWLYAYKIDVDKISYNTFQQLRCHLYKYLLPSLGASTKLSKITSQAIEIAVRQIPYPVTKRAVTITVKQLFRFAFTKNYLAHNPAVIALRSLETEIEKPQKRNIEPYTISELRLMLFKCRELFPDMYMPLLLSLTAGLRISETIAVKYSDIDFTSLMLHIEWQLGKAVQDFDGKDIQEKEVKLKTRRSDRWVPLPQWVVDEIIVKKAWYESVKMESECFIDSDYICCHSNGSPFSRGHFRYQFKNLLKMCGLREIHWHDLRHMYASILKGNELNMKAISLYLGHATPEFTEDTYIYDEPVVYDCTEMEEIWKILKPDAPSAGEEVYEIPFDIEDMEFWKI